MDARPLSNDGILAERFDAAVIGLGPAGTQSALVLARFGMKVLAVGREPPHDGMRSGWRGLGSIALRLAREAAEALPGSGAKVMPGEAQGLEWSAGRYAFSVGELRFEAEHLVLATGRPSRPDRLAAGMDVDRAGGGLIETDGNFATSHGRLHAVGDLADGCCQSVQNALGSGHLAARHIAMAVLAWRRRAA
ncbi:MAG: hypothetical protein EOR63_32240 [Mesorhizobium sp.]|nr:MAG: hypothetical protein EOR63_32240 [Mesorhizobium sp.]